MILLVNPVVRANPSIQKIGKVMRLSFEGVQPLSLKAQKSKAQGGKCNGAATDDLILSFKGQPAWVNTFNPTDYIKDDEASPCEVKGRPFEGSENFELRLSYKAVKGRSIDAITYSSSAATYVDHWFSYASKNLNPTLKVNVAGGESTKGFSEFFENPISWQRISGKGSESSDVNSPGLDKFRDYPIEINPGIAAEPIERLALKLPVLDLPLVPFSIEFEERPLPLKKFDSEDVAEFKSLSDQKRKLMLESLNLILLLVEKKEWARAFESITILEKSSLKPFIPRHRASWFALKGYISAKYADTPFPDTAKDGPGLLFQKALDDWREGIRLFSGLGGINQEYAEYMIVEIVRNLLNRKLPFAALSTIVWSQKYSWSAITEERFEYLKGVALENLALFSEAEAAFKTFFNGRSSLSASVIHDRRLVPAAALWPGDIALKQNNYKKAVDEYTDALNKIPSPRRFSFEKMWYPDLVRQFPEVLMNRAEASMRLGQHSNALRDLRAFIFVAPNHSFTSVAYFRVGDLLEQLGGDAKKTQGAWRECVFRFRDQMAGPLCQSRLAYHRLLEKDVAASEWPRLIAEIEDANQSVTLLPKYSFAPDDVKIFLGLLLSDAFLKSEQPLQALLRLDPLDNLQPSQHMGLWYREFRITALQGVLSKRLAENTPRLVISEYAKRQKTLFLYQTRGEILYYLAEAFAALELWQDARKTLDQGKRVRDVLKRQVTRIYDPTSEQWKISEANINTHLFALGKTSEKAAFDALSLAPENSGLVKRNWVLFFQTKKDSKSEVLWWKKLELNSPLSGDDLVAYAKALEETKATADLKDLLEKRFGVALTESADAKIDKKLSSELFLKLAELRRSSKEYDRALTVLNYLLTLEPKQLHVRTPRVLLMYQKGVVLKDLRRLEESLKAFREAQVIAPDSIWGKLSKSNALEIDASLKRQSENR